MDQTLHDVYTSFQQHAMNERSVANNYNNHIYSDCVLCTAKGKK